MVDLSRRRDRRSSIRLGAPLLNAIACESPRTKLMFGFSIWSRDCHAHTKRLSFLRFCWRAPVILITCQGILTRMSNPISQAQLFLFSSEIALSSHCLPPRNAGCVAKMKVSIVILCYNEKDTIEKVVEAIRNAPLNTKENHRGGRLLARWDADAAPREDCRDG